jgi:autotransporter-associated beta strand protein
MLPDPPMLKEKQSGHHDSPGFSGIVWLRSLLFAALIVSFPTARAAIIYGLNSDTDIRDDGLVGAANGTSLLAGGTATPIADRAAVYVFQLPNFGAVPNPFTTAKFQFHILSKSGTPPNVDLYGLGRRANSTVLASDYYGETTTADPTDATLLQTNILTSAIATGVRATSTAGGTALINYLNAQYASGAGAGQYVFLRFSTETTATGANRYALTPADTGAAGSQDTRPQIIYNLPSGYTRPFIWVRDSEKSGINVKIAGNAWATSVYNGMVSRVASDLASHQSNRDAFLRGLPVVDWAAATPKFKTIPAYSESSVRYPAEARFNDALDCAVLYYLTGDAQYARCAGDILHNAVKTLLPVTASTNTGNGGWIFQNDFLKEARVTGTQLPIVYDFLYSWLQTNQVYDVKSATMVNFNFTNAQSVFRKYYQLARDHGQKESNWSALESTTMLNNLLALDDPAERSTALQVYLVNSTSKQASLDYDYRHYTQAGNIWPESLQYAGAVGSIRSTHMVLLERVDPDLSLFNAYPNLPLSLPRISYMRYPNGEQITFGDGIRPNGGQPYHQYELVYQHALARGRTDLTSFFGSLINGGVAGGNYNRSALDSYATLGTQTEPLQLLWQAAAITEPGVTPELPRTDTLPFAGIALQRNHAPANNVNYGLMCFVGGAGHVHSHASGMSMELFGMGEVMGAKSGTESYGTDINENYYRVFASNNTVVVNGASRGEGGWGGFAINTVQTVAMEPQPFATAVSPSFSFTTSSFADDKGTLAEGTQQRTLAIVRTSSTTGYYVDVFRSKSTVTNRTATTLNGPVTNQYHDYIYRNIGETAVDLRADGVTLPLVSQANRFQNDIGDANEQPGWRYFANTTVSYPTTSAMKAQFVATVGGTPRYMDMHMPAVASREYAKVDSPPIEDAPGPYNSRAAPTLVIRQIGEAWNKAFATVYEPHFGSSGGTVQNVTQLLRSGIVVGVKVESTVGMKNMVHYILSNPAAGETFTDATAGISFTGRFGIAADNGDGTTTLYLGDGSSLAYRGNSVATVSGSASQAEVLFTPGQSPVVTSNTAVNVVVAPPPPGFTWVPTVGGAYDWTNTANWNPATVPNTVGGIAYKNINITGNQTVNVNTPVTLGEIVVGDNSGTQTTLLQKNTSGSLVMDQAENGAAYLTRTAGGTGTVTFQNDLNIALNDNLTVRLAGGSANSTMVIAGVLSGSGKSLTKEGGSLTLSLTGANTYSGATRIQAGILSLGHSLALQNSVLDSANSVTGDATNGLRTTVASLTLGGLTGSRDFATMFTNTSGGFSGLTALTLDPDTGASLDYTGAIANGAAGMTLTKTGLGTQTLSGANIYTGATTISAGTLEIGGAGKLGNGAYAGNIAIGNGAVFKYSSSAAQTLSGSISGAGTLVKNTGSSVLTINGSNTSFTGPVTLNSGTLIMGNTNALSAASALTLTGTTTLKTSVQNANINASVNVSGTPEIHAPDFGTGSTVSTLTLGGAISGSGDVTFSSLSTVANNSQQTILLTAQSSYAGETILNPAASGANLIVKLGIANALPTTTVLSINGVAGGGTGRFAEFDLGGSNQTIGGLQNTPAGSLRSQQVANSGVAATLTINNTTDHVFSGILDGNNLHLAKTGAGTQTLAGVNTMTGITTVTGGRLLCAVGGSSASSSVVINNALATFGVSITDNTKNWTCSSLSTTAAGNLEFNFGSVPPGAAGPLIVTGPAAFSTTPVVRVITSTGLAPGTYPLMTWGSTSGTAPSVVNVLNPAGTGGLADGSTATLTISGNTLNLVIIAVPVSVKAQNTNNLNLGTSWVGGAVPNASATAIWNNTVTSANTTVLGANLTWAGITINNPTGSVTINAGHTLTLGANENDINMSSATANLTLNCPLILGDANIWNVASGRTLTIGGGVAGSFPITKAGPGTALLTGNNPFNDDITLSANSGILEIGGAGTLEAGTHAGAIDIGSGSTFRYNSSAAQTFNGAVSGAGILMKNAGSTLTLGGANPSFTGSVEINAGTLNLANTGALGNASMISIAGGATLSTQTTGISVAVPITLGAAATNSTISFGRNTSAQGIFTLNESIGGSATLTFTTPNVSSSGNLQTIVLGSANNYSGNTLITTGNSGNALSVKAAYADVLPSTTVLTLNGGNGSGSGRTVTFDLNGYDQTIAGLTNDISTLTARNQRINNTSADRATLTINNSTDFTFGGTGVSSTFNGNPVNPTAQITGNLDLIKMGPGRFTLAPGAGNTFSGTTTVLEGILSLGHATSLQNSPLDTFSSVGGDASNGLQATVTTLTLGGLVGDKNLAAVFTTTSGGFSNLTAISLNPGAGVTVEYAGSIANGAPGMTLIKTGTGMQILSGPNSHTGATLINAGTLALGASDVLPTTTVSIGDATLDVAVFTDTVGALNLTGPATIDLDVDGRIAFADSSAIDWTNEAIGGTLTITGAFISGSSLRFGTTNTGLTAGQLARISIHGNAAHLALDDSGYLISGYAAWKAANAPVTGTNPNADEDGDGVPNGIEYLLGGTISSNDLAKLPQVSTAGGNMFFTFVREQKSIDGVTTVEIQLCEDLAGWTASYPVPGTAIESNPGVTVQKDVPVAGKDTVTFSLPVSGLTKFARLKVVPS